MSRYDKDIVALALETLLPVVLRSLRAPHRGKCRVANIDNVVKSVHVSTYIMLSAEGKHYEDVDKIR